MYRVLPGESGDTIVYFCLYELCGGKLSGIGSLSGSRSRRSTGKYWRRKKSIGSCGYTSELSRVRSSSSITGDVDSPGTGGVSSSDIGILRGKGRSIFLNSSYRVHYTIRPDTITNSGIGNSSHLK